MNIRKISIVLGLIILVGSFFLFRFLAAGPDEDSQITQASDTSVGVVVLEAAPKQIAAQIVFTGTVIPEDELELFAEVTGNLTSDIEIKPGVSFRKGDSMISIDDGEFRQSVYNQRSQFQSLLTQALADIRLDYPEEEQAWSRYLLNYSIQEDLSPLPDSDNPTFQLFLAGRNIISTYYSIKQSEVRLSKYTIKAPFNGTLTESLINPGTLVRSNQKLGTFIRTGEYEIEASIKAEDRNFISIGDQVSISLEGSSTTSLKATVSRINAQVDPTTQTLLVYLNIKSDGVLPGEYVTGTITGRRFENAQKVATKALVRNEMLFIVQNEVAVIRPVNVLSTVQDSTIVSGLYPGDLVIDEFRDAAFEGTAVTPLLK